MAMVNSIKIRDMVLTALLAAFLCIIGPFSIHIGPVPITLSLVGVYLAPSVLGWKRGTVAVLIYLLLGLVGMPVFSNFTGGVQKLVGPTGGYLVGDIPCAFLTGFITYMLRKKVWANVLGMILGTVVLYLLGTAWYSIQAGTTFYAALAVCVIPFVPFDAAKMVLVAAIAPPLRAVAEKR